MAQKKVNAAPSGPGKDFADQVINDEGYRSFLLTRARAGILAPAVEVELMRLSMGRPVERVQLSVEGGAKRDLSQVPTEELLKRASARVQQIFAKTRKEETTE
jgi:hypothetical protein